MESTGGQFMPCWKDIFDLIVGNARRIRNVPGEDGGEGCRVISG